MPLTPRVNLEQKMNIKELLLQYQNNSQNTELK